MEKVSKRVSFTYRGLSFDVQLYFIPEKSQKVQSYVYMFSCKWPNVNVFYVKRWYLIISIVIIEQQQTKSVCLSKNCINWIH